MTSTAIFLTGIAIGAFGTIFAEALIIGYIGYKSKQFDDIKTERRCDW